MSKVVVIGGGVIGCAVRERLNFEGLRPVTRDGIPIVEVMGARNLGRRNGHHRKGFSWRCQQRCGSRRLSREQS